MARTVQLLLVGALLAGCGGNGDEPTTAPETPRSSAAPKLQGPALLEMERLGNQMGTSDRVFYGKDGSAVMIKAYGGGGYYAWRCRLSRAELTSLERAVAALPLGPAPRHAAAKRPSYYSPPPAQFVIRAGRYTDSFTADAQPRDARPLVAHMTRILYGREAHCRQTFGQRVRG